MAGRPLSQVDQSSFAGQVAARIRARRLRKKLSAEQCAAAAGVPASTWYSWETGRRSPNDSLPRIAAALGCTLRYLVGE